MTSSFQIGFKRFMAIILLFSPTFAWFYLMNSLLYQFRAGIFEIPEWVWIGEATYLLSILGSAIIGSMLSERLNRRRFFGFWILFGVLTTISFALFEDPTIFLFLSILSGISFGIGFPSCLAFINDSTATDERARVSGATMLITFVILMVFIGSVGSLEVIHALILTAIFRAISFFTLLIDPCERTPSKKTTWKSVFTTNGFDLYFVSWLMYYGAGGLTAFVGSWLPSSDWDTLESLGLLLNWAVGVGIIGFLSSFASDFFGRRRVIMLGLISLGLSYAIFGVTLTGPTYLITQIFFGASYGIMFINFFMTTLGELSPRGSKERYFAAGSIFLILPSSIQLIANITKIQVDPSIIAAIMTIILFVAVLPLLYAPETMPSEKLRARKFRKYLKKVKKVVEEEEP